MSDEQTGANVGIDTLHDAFAELERRAEEYPLTELGRRPGRSRTPLLLVAASVAVVLALAVLASVRFGAGPARHPTAPAGVERHPGIASVRPGAHTEHGGRPMGAGRSAPPLNHAVPAPRATHQSNVADFEQKFAAAFHDVAGDAASYSLTLRPAGSVLVGEMTVNGVAGGFDIQDYSAGPGAKATCDDLDRVKCDVRSMPNGASLATGSEPLQTDPGGVTLQANYVRSDGVEFIMHVSNAADPKGAGKVGPKPPLTIAQLVAILTSDRWTN
jgi:hypothetical protein